MRFAPNASDLRMTDVLRKFQTTRPIIKKRRRGRGWGRGRRRKGAGGGEAKNYWVLPS